ncbi:MAG: ABC transporter ATP-binding protein [Candidatus Methanomethylicia archaeon]
MDILEVKELKKSFGELIAVNEVSFNIKEGEVVAIIGPNGAGKTTLINLISRWIKEDKGVIKFLGKDMKYAGPIQALEMGVARSFQIPRVFGKMSVLDNIRLAITSKEKKSKKILSFFESDKNIKEKAIEILEKFNLSEKMNLLADELPHGDKKLLDVAIAFSLSPKLLLLDEPTSGVSAAEKTSVMDRIIDTVKRERITTILVEHDMDVVFGYSSRILVMNEGKIIADDTPNKILNNNLVKQVMGGK